METRQVQRAFVVSDVCGRKGGAYLVTAFLAQALCDLSIDTTCFTTTLDPSYKNTGDFVITRPILQRGYRWDIPNRILAWQIARAIKNRKPKLIIAVGMTALCGHLLRYPCVKESNTWVWELTSAELGNKFVKPSAVKNLPNAQGMLSPAQMIDNAIRKNYSYTGDIRRLPFWIEESTNSYTPPPTKFNCDFLFLSRREDDKGLADLIRACGILRSRNITFKLQIAGIGNSIAYQNQVADQNVKESVTFVELPQREQAMEAIANTKYIVLPSHHEGFPISVLEGMQRSIPFITTRVGAIPEILGEHGAAIYHEKMDQFSLANALESAMKTGIETYIQQRKIAFNQYQKTFSKTEITKILQSLLE